MASDQQQQQHNNAAAVQLVQQQQTQQQSLQQQHNTTATATTANNSSSSSSIINGSSSSNNNNGGSNSNINNSSSSSTNSNGGNSNNGNNNSSSNSNNPHSSTLQGSQQYLQHHHSSSSGGAGGSLHPSDAPPPPSQSSSNNTSINSGGGIKTPSDRSLPSLPTQSASSLHSNNSTSSGSNNNTSNNNNCNQSAAAAISSLPPPPQQQCMSSSVDQHQHQQQFCLRWNNFQSNIVNSFETLLNREELVDVTLTAEGRSLRAHRVLLSACSPYFRDLFQDLPSHQHPVIVLRDTRFLELKCLLCFIYHGEVNVSQDNLSCLLNLAENLKVKGLAQEGTKRHHPKEYEYGGGRGVLSPDREDELSDGGGEGGVGGPGMLPHHGGNRLLRPPSIPSPSCHVPTMPPHNASSPSFVGLGALGNLLGGGGGSGGAAAAGGMGDLARTHLEESRLARDLVRDRDRDQHQHHQQHHHGSNINNKNSAMLSGGQQQHDRPHLHVLHQQQQQQHQQQHLSPPSKRRKRPLSPHSNNSSSSSSNSMSGVPLLQASAGIGNTHGIGNAHGAATAVVSNQLQQQHNQQQQQHLKQAISPPETHSNNNNNSSSSRSNNHGNSSVGHTPTLNDETPHAVNLSTCPSSGSSPPRLMVPKLELITNEEDSGGDKERLERLEQRERLCNLIEKERIAGMISSVKLGGGFIDSDMEGDEEELPPPSHHDDENSADMEGHGSGVPGLPHPLSHHLPPGLQQSFVPYPPTTHAAAAAAAAAAHHFASTFSSGPSGVPSSVSPASWRSHGADQNPNSPQGTACSTTMSALETLVDSLGEEQPSQGGSVNTPQSSTQELQRHPGSSSSSTAKNKDTNPPSLENKSLVTSLDNELSSMQSNGKKHCVPDELSITVNTSGQRASRKVETNDVAVEDEQSTAEITIEDPTVMLKCELMMEETSKDSNDCKQDDMEWINELHEIEKKEIVVNDNMEHEPFLDFSYSVEKSIGLNDKLTHARQTDADPNNIEQKWPTNSNLIRSALPSNSNFDVRHIKVANTKYTNISATSNKQSDITRRPVDKRAEIHFKSADHTDTTKSVTENDSRSSIIEVDDEDDKNEVCIINDIGHELDSSLLIIPEICTSFSDGSDAFHGCSFPYPQGSIKDNSCSGGGGGGGGVVVTNVGGGSSSINLSSLQGLLGTNLGPSPSRQSCLCPLCGRHISQRRSLKQHLMSNFHKLSAIEADHTTRTTGATRQR